MGEEKNNLMDGMKAYIGTKIIMARPMNRGGTAPNVSGYEVMYPDGYGGWSPKEAFENAYREITPGEFKLIT